MYSIDTNDCGQCQKIQPHFFGQIVEYCIIVSFFFLNKYMLHVLTSMGIKVCNYTQYTLFSGAVSNETKHFSCLQIILSFIIHEMMMLADITARCIH